uniref:Uncharacterized protein n=1 Tax=Timema tahoe TaxID=61484 RepID=A0A7R9ILS5_9NEOP|nr:unnamed protein product [Timema tahoe]
MNMTQTLIFVGKDNIAEYHEWTMNEPIDIENPGYGTSMAPFRVDDVVPKPKNERIGATGKPVIERLCQLPEVVLNGRNPQVTIQSHIANYQGASRVASPPSALATILLLEPCCPHSANFDSGISLTYRLKSTRHTKEPSGTPARLLLAWEVTFPKSAQVRSSVCGFRGVSSKHWLFNYGPEFEPPCRHVVGGVPETARSPTQNPWRHILKSNRLSPCATVVNYVGGYGLGGEGDDTTPGFESGNSDKSTGCGHHNTHSLIWSQGEGDGGGE